jgi:hypothetical protein
LKIPASNAEETMMFEHSPGLEETVTGWIDEALGDRHTPSARSRFQEAANHGLLGRIRALGGALSCAHAGKVNALDAASALTRRVFVMATVYDLAELRNAALAVERGCDAVRDDVVGCWIHVNSAFDALQSVARRDLAD